MLRDLGKGISPVSIKLKITIMTPTSFEIIRKAE